MWSFTENYNVFNKHTKFLVDTTATVNARHKMQYKITINDHKHFLEDEDKQHGTEHEIIEDIKTQEGDVIDSLHWATYTVQTLLITNNHIHVGVLIAFE